MRSLFRVKQAAHPNTLFHVKHTPHILACHLSPTRPPRPAPRFGFESSSFPTPHHPPPIWLRFVTEPPRKSPPFPKKIIAPTFGLPTLPCYYCRLSRVFAIANQKGGVGKTTTAINLAASLAANDLRVLVIDSDPQGNATTGLGVAKDPSHPSLYQVLLGDVPPRDAVVPTGFEGLSLITADKNLVGANLELVGLDARELRLRQRIADIRNEYDFILIDCPPALDLLTLNALLAADAVLVPIQCEFFALEGISELMDTIRRIREAFAHPLEIAGILLTMFDDRTNLTRQVAADLKEFFGDQVFRTVIPRSVRIAEAPSFGKPILTYDPRSRGAESYIQLAKEILDHEQAGQSTPGAR